MLFISHKTEDKDIANEVLRRVLAHGYSDKQIFLDSDPGSGIEAGAAQQRKSHGRLKHTREIACSSNYGLNEPQFDSRLDFWSAEHE